MTVDDDLRALQRRAYGADADIQSDPEALARLRLLEAERRVAIVRPTPPPLPKVSTPPPKPSIVAGIPAELVGSAAVVTEPADPEPLEVADDPSPRRRVRSLVLACAATAVVTALVTVPVTRWVAAVEGPRPYAVLQPYADTEPLRYYDGPMREGSLRYPDFYGIQLTVGGFEDGDSTCILVVLGSDSGSGSCSPSGLDPQFDLAVAEAPSAARIEFGDDAALRFVSVGDELQIYVVHPEEQTPSPLPAA